VTQLEAHMKITRMSPNIAAITPKACKALYAGPKKYLVGVARNPIALF
jgi:hypothetical protein